MTFPNIFTQEVTFNFIDRINNLSPQTPALWGKMNVAQMLAHCNVTYELVYDNKHPKPNFLMKQMIKLFAKKTVTGSTPYKQSLRTAPMFLIADDRDFQAEKQRLIDYLRKTQQLGEDHFDDKESHSFGHLSKDEWNNLFYKHLDHHLKQFGV